MNSPHTWPVTRKMFPFDDVIICCDAVNKTKFLTADEIIAIIVQPRNFVDIHVCFDVFCYGGRFLSLRFGFKSKALLANMHAR